MPLNDAMKFIKAAGRNEELRYSLYSVPADKIYDTLEDKGYKFNEYDFEESVNMLHVQCQTYEQANLLFEVVNWFRMLLRRPEPIEAFQN